MRRFIRGWESRLTRTKEIPLGSDRPSSGFGYVVIPSDIPRNEYIRLFFSTGYLIIVTPQNESIKDVLCPVHLLQDIVFPKLGGEYGSLISWMNIPSTNQVVINGIHLKPGEIPFYKEGVKTEEFSGSKKTLLITKDPNLGQITISCKNDFDQSGGITLVSRHKSQSKATLLSSGKAKFYGEVSSTLHSEKLIELIVGSKEGEVSSFIIDLDKGTLLYEDKSGNLIEVKQDSITFDAPKIYLGKQNTEPAVKGQKLVTLLGQLIDQISLLTVICTAPGAPSLPPINAPAFQAIRSQLQSMLSTKVEIG